MIRRKALCPILIAIRTEQDLPADLCAIAWLCLEVFDDGPVVTIEDGDAVATVASFHHRQVAVIGGKLEIEVRLTSLRQLVL